jgi:molecular chaperone GrpE
MTNEQDQSAAEATQDDASPDGLVVGAGLDEAGKVEPSVQEAFADLQRDLDQTVPFKDMDQLRDEVKQAQDRTLRATAELENVRKRSQREITDARRYAALPLVRDLLTVADNLDRAIEAAQQSDESAGLLEGVRMVAQQLHTTLENHGCARIEAEGQPFDPHLHEAILQQPSADVPPGTVVLETQSGYELNGRVVRPSQVIVSAAPAEDAAEEAAVPDSDD